MTDDGRRSPLDAQGTMPACLSAQKRQPRLTSQEDGMSEEMSGPQT